MTVGTFDHVSIRRGAGWNLVSAEEFWKLPLEERVSLILDQKIQFIRDGNVIPVREALRRGASPEGGVAPAG